jgi:hypothetical protein
MNKTKRMATLKHRHHQAKMKEKRRVQGLAVPIKIKHTPSAEIIAAHAEAVAETKKRVIHRKETKPEAVEAAKPVITPAKPAKAKAPKAEPAPKAAVAEAPKKRGRPTKKATDGTEG